MFGPPIVGFQKMRHSESANRPTTSPGTTVTPGQDTYGTYAQIMTAVSENCYGIWVNINSNSVSGQIKDTLVTIGYDPAGGSSYTDLISHLLGSDASTWGNSVNVMGGHSYYFPIFIPSGSTIAAKASVHNATVGTVKVMCAVYSKPIRPDLLRVGRYVVTFGEVTGSSTGTAITEGTTSEGTWTQLGSNIAANKNLWYWDVGVGCTAVPGSATQRYIDLSIGTATNNKLILENKLYVITTTPQVGHGGACFRTFAQGAVGDGVYVRSQSSAAAQSITAIAYAVGG